MSVKLKVGMYNQIRNMSDWFYILYELGLNYLSIIEEADGLRIHALNQLTQIWNPFQAIKLTGKCPMFVMVIPLKFQHQVQTESESGAQAGGVACVEEDTQLRQKGTFLERLASSRRNVQDQNLRLADDVYCSSQYTMLTWMAELNSLLQELIAVSKTNQETKLTEEEENERIQRVVIPLIEQAMDHYAVYYDAKCKGSNRDILSMMTSSWTSSLKNTFYWIGGWRPSTAFQCHIEPTHNGAYSPVSWTRSFNFRGTRTHLHPVRLIRKP